MQPAQQEYIPSRHCRPGDPKHKPNAPIATTSISKRAKGAANARILARKPLRVKLE